MTTFFRIKRKCAICEHEAEYTEISSTNRFGYLDLDTRPPMMERLTIDNWVQCCPACGYCNSDITKEIAGARQFINEPVYRKQLKLDEKENKETDFIKRIMQMKKDLANKFLAQSLLNENAKEFVKAGWAALHAAWAFDDDNNDHRAAECRIRAAELFLKAIDNGDKIMDEGAEVLLADIFRRAGEFEKAAEYVDKGIDKVSDDLMKKILEFEKALIIKKDTQCYSVEKAIKN